MNNKIIIVSSVLLVILLIYLSNDSVSESFSGFSGLNIMGSDELNNVAKLGKWLVVIQNQIILSICLFWRI